MWLKLRHELLRLFVGAHRRIDETKYGLHPFIRELRQHLYETLAYVSNAESQCVEELLASVI